jgi:hypothetical protein
MLQTLEHITVKQIEKTFGRCGSCHRYRGCNHESESKILCLDCVTTLRNQQRLTIISQPKTEPSSVKQAKLKTPRVRKNKPKEIKNKPKEIKNKPKEIKNKPKEIKNKPKEIKNKPKEIKKKIKLYREFGSGLLQKEILDLLKRNNAGFSLSDIARKLRSLPTSTWITTTRLVEDGEIVYVGKQRNRIYAHHSHAEVLEKYRGVCVSRLPTIEKVKAILDASDKITSATEIYSKIKGKKSKTSIRYCLRFLVVRGDAVSCFDYQEHGEKFVSTTNEKAFFDFNNNQPHHKILNFLKDGPKNKQEISQHLGNLRRCTIGVSKILAELQGQGKIAIAPRPATRKGVFFELTP